MNYAYDMVKMDDHEYGSNVPLDVVAFEHFRAHIDCDYVEVREHGGWFLGFRRDGSVWCTANDAAPRLTNDEEYKNLHYSGHCCRRIGERPPLPPTYVTNLGTMQLDWKELKGKEK